MDFNFEPILVVLTAIAGFFSLLDLIFFARKRKQQFLIIVEPYRSSLIVKPYSNLRAFLQKLAIVILGRKTRALEFPNLRHVLPPNVYAHSEEILQPKGLLDYARSFFPVFLLVLVIRSFLFEGYLVPTGSLEPTVLPGDLLLVDKYSYGLRLPLMRKSFLETGAPRHARLAVFKWPDDKNNYVKRVIGVPGDRISYLNKTLYINGQKMEQTFIDEETDGRVRMEENLLGVKHDILLNPERPAVDFQEFIVPPGFYFMMGDNRDNSQDSRYRGFVSYDGLIGQADFIFFSKIPNEWKFRWDRIGNVFHR